MSENRQFLQQSLLSSPTLPTWSKSEDDENHARNCHYCKYHVNTHNYFPFFLLVIIHPLRFNSCIIRCIVLCIIVHRYFFSFSGAKIRIIFRSTKWLTDFLVIFSYRPQMGFIDHRFHRLAQIKSQRRGRLKIEILKN